MQAKWLFAWSLFATCCGDAICEIVGALSTAAIRLLTFQFAVIWKDFGFYLYQSIIREFIWVYWSSLRFVVCNTVSLVRWQEVWGLPVAAILKQCLFRFYSVHAEYLVPRIFVFSTCCVRNQVLKVVTTVQL
jgi:hypothetical protein